MTVPCAERIGIAVTGSCKLSLRTGFTYTFMNDHVIKSRRGIMKFVEASLTLGNLVKAEER